MDEREQILQMIAEGKISAAEGADLLDALRGGQRAAPSADAPIIDGATGEVIEPSAPPDFGRFRRFWVYPFAASVTLVGISGVLLGLLYQGDGFWSTLGLLCVWPLLLLGIAATLLSLWSRYATWLHVRVQEKGGRRIAVSLPLPLNLARWGIGHAGRFVPSDQAGSLSMAGSFLDQFEKGGDPLVISVDDEDGDQVQVYFG